MLVDHLAHVNVGDDVAVAEKHVFGVVVLDVAHRALERLEPAAVDAAALAAREGGQDDEAPALAGEVPRAARAHVVHQRLVVLLGDDPDILDVGIDHAREHEVDQAVASAVGHRAGRAPLGQLAEHAVVHIGENNPHYFIFSHILIAPPERLCRSSLWGLPPRLRRL